MKILLMLGIVLYASISIADGDWELVQDENEIRIYTRPNDKTNVKDFKADIIISASIEAVNSHMSAVEKQSKWIYNRELTKVLDKPNDRTTIVYSVTNAPWPVTNRDAVVSFTYSESNTDEFIRIDVASINNYYPLNEDYVRVLYIRGFWELIKIDNNRTKVVFMNAVSPGGHIPGWLADSFVLDMPYHSLNNFRYMFKSVN